MARIAPSVFNLGHTLSFPPAPPSSEAKKSHITHRKSNYAAFRLDERFREGRITFNRVPLCISETNLCYYTT